MKKIYFILLTVAMLLNFAPGIHAQQTRAGEGEGEGEGEEVDYTIDGVFQRLLGETLHFTTGSYDEKNNVGFSKEISAPVDGKYYIRLEALAKGTATVTEITKPSDIILVLDYSSSMDNSRRNALRTAVRSFLTTIRDKDQVARGVDPNFGGHRVAVMSFNANATKLYDLTQINTGYTTMYNYFGNDFGTANYTNPASALNLAMEQWNIGGQATTDETRTRAVVVFTDGCPSHTGSYDFDCDYAKDAIDAANKFKSDYDASVYAVGLFSTSHNSWRTIGQHVLDYMNFMSSNFTGVTSVAPPTGQGSMTTNGSVRGTITYSFPEYPDISTVAQARQSEKYADATEAQAGNSDYFFMATNASSLEAIFKKIANQTGTADNTSLSAATATVDVVASSFDLPNGADTEIYIFTAPYQMNEAGTGPEWGPETLADHSTDLYDQVDADGRVIREDVDVDNAIDYDIVGNKITVTGFDYSSNWCGPIKNASQQIIGYQGHKLIIIIPIQMNENAVGGPNVATNEPGSGIYANATDTEPVIKFETQHVSLPVNLHINKQNLKVGESAKFDIMRASLTNEWPKNPTADDYNGLDWKYMTTVFVTRHSNDDEDDPIVKIKGLPSKSDDGPYIYKIVEKDWSWSYTFKQATDSSGTIVIEDKELVTSDKFITNPIIFENTPETDIDKKVRHAESKATNTFTGNGKVGYDDSRGNGRKVIGDPETN